MKYIFLIPFSLFILFSCSTKSTQKVVHNSGSLTDKSMSTINEKSQSSNSYEELAENKFGENVRYQMNDDKTFVICSKRIDENNFNYLKLFVFDLGEGRIIYEPKDRVRKASWIDNEKIEVHFLVGVSNANDPNGKIIYNVNTKEELFSN